MDASDHENLEKFTASIMDNLQKNGFPGRKVAFSLEQLYESAARKDLSFNKVLERLAAHGIAHEKTPERVIFSLSLPDAAAAQELLGGMDLSALEGLSPDQMMAAASQVAQQMSPEQLEAIRAMVGNLSPEQMQAMMEQARKLGLG